MNRNSELRLWDAIRRLSLAIEEVAQCNAAALGTAGLEVLRVELTAVNKAVESAVNEAPDAAR